MEEDKKEHQALDPHKNKGDESPGVSERIDKESKEDIEDEKSKQNVKRSFSLFSGSLIQMLKGILEIRLETDFENTTNSIKRDIDFKGHNVWILVFSIFIASIGLNTNSTAAIIGAMLISPLMGPILGVGFSVGTNDLTMLKRSMKSLGVAVTVALITSTIYFSISPLTDADTEILGRTKPTFLDALIALFGGLAGIVAASRKEKSNVIPGVAIATALMPPLCAAGFGLANGKFEYFFGAFYLFLLNSIFISMSTYIIVRYLRFPLVKFIDPIRERKVKRYITLFTLVTLIPSGIIFWNVTKASLFENRAESFLLENIHYSGSSVMNSKINYNDTVPFIEVYMIGENVPDKVIDGWKRQLQQSQYKLEGTKLRIIQNKDNSAQLAGQITEMRGEILENLYLENSQKLKDKNEKIAFLESTIMNLKKHEIPLKYLSLELSIEYHDLAKFSFAKAVESDFKRTDTIPTFMVQWKEGTDVSESIKNQVKMARWLKVRLQLDTVRIINY